MRKELVVITGGPGTGKTTIIEGLQKLGYQCFPEISRQITLQAKIQGIEQLFLEKPLLFSELLLEGRKNQYELANSESANMVFLDRGIPDILAYMHYIGDSYPSFFDQACKDHLYTKIFILPPWEEIYISDEARYENYEQATLIFEHLKETYLHYNYKLIEVPKANISERIDFILKSIKK